MIVSYCYDIEVLKNFFSITFINLNSYLKVFADCEDGSKKHKPIPITQKYSVVEIKSKLEQVEKIAFYITDTDDSQLLPMLGFINNLHPHYNEQNKPVRSDLFGYNSSKYDKLMMAAFLMYANQINTTKELITKLYETSKHIIEMQDNPEVAKHDYYLSSLHKFSIPYIDIDVMTIFALNKVGKGVNNKGETIYFGKSLKQTSINLQWYELLEYELPPISDKDIHFYDKDIRYKGMSPEQVNKLVNKWDRYIIDEWINDTMHYNLNDVFIVCEMVRLYIDEVRLRYAITKSYGVDVLSSSRSNIADKLFIKFYSEFSGLSESQWRGKTTERTALAFKRVIFDFISFKTKPLQEFLEELKQVVIYSIGLKALKEIAPKYPNLKYLKTDTNNGWFEITINNLTYTVATGGLHSQDVPSELRSKLKPIVIPSTGEGSNSSMAISEDANPYKLSDFKEGGNKNNGAPSVWDYMDDDSYIYIHFDIASYYPSLMDVYRIAPAHINECCFVRLIHWLKETRVAAKHSNKPIDGIPADILAQALKIVINSIYGKLGFSKGDICDRLAVLKVTINGQLLMLMLCEELELNGIRVMSANTDGIVVKLYKRDKAKFDEITGNWKKRTGLEADGEEYLCYVNRDINNYIIQELNGKTSYKGALHPTMYANDLQKGYSMPVVAQAIANFFLYNKPVLESLYECKNILDFCLTQNVGSQFHVEYTSNGSITPKIMQRNVRYYVTNKGGVVEKVHNQTNARAGLCAGQQVCILNTLDDKRIEYRNINYGFYYKEAIKIIDPIKLGISPNQKGNPNVKTKSGKSLIKQKSGMYNSLFDDNE